MQNNIGIFVLLCMFQNFILFCASTDDWYLAFPTMGILHQEPALYPFLPHFFSLDELAPHNGAGIQIGLLDTDFLKNSTQDNPWKLDKTCLMMQGHGFYTTSLIKRLAPQATVTIFPAFDSCGRSTQSRILEFMQQAVNNHMDLICLGLKFNGSMESGQTAQQEMDILCSQIPFTVVASGNNETILPYPASSPTIPFTVGAFGLDDTKAFIPDFSTFQKDKGPLFVAPGVQITGEWPQGSLLQTDHMFAHGTSVAAAVFTGMIGRILGEFLHDMTRREIIAACYFSCLKMHDNEIWRSRVILGVLDLRMALFTLHVMRKLKEWHRAQNRPYNFTQDPVIICSLIRSTLLKDVQRYATRFKKKIYFEQVFLEYRNQAEKNTDKLSQFIDANITLEAAVEAISISVRTQFKRDK